MLLKWLHWLLNIGKPKEEYELRIYHTNGAVIHNTSFDLEQTINRAEIAMMTTNVTGFDIRVVQTQHIIAQAIK